VLGQEVDELPAQDACLVDFAQSLTARPWTVGVAEIRRLTAAGFSDQAIVLVVGLVAMFNYLTRVADGTGIEADYGGVLPEFAYRGLTDSAPRPAPEDWPTLEPDIPCLSLLPGVAAAVDRWREYVAEGSDPLSPAVRHRLRWVTARNTCDGTVPAPDPAGTQPEDQLDRFADKLSRTPWLMSQADVDDLRTTGLDDRAVLHVIATVAYQSAESRLRIGLSALARAGS